MPHVATSIADLLEHLRGAAHVEGDRLVIDDEARFRADAIRDLAWTAAFTTDDPTAEAARWLVWEASQALGYKEMFDHLDGLAGLDETVRRIQTRTRHFAKRQLTWLRHLPGCRPVDAAQALCAGEN